MDYAERDGLAFVPWFPLSAGAVDEGGPRVIHHIVQDPRDPKVLLMAAKTGHLGPTVFRSKDRGRKWKEAAQPPAY